jgi:DHA2 family multidrug resistance protein
MQASNPVFAQRLAALANAYGGGSGGEAMARGQIYKQLNQQASVLGYADVYRLLSWMAVGMVLCAFLLSKNKPGETAPVGAE